MRKVLKKKKKKVFQKTFVDFLPVLRVTKFGSQENWSLSKYIQMRNGPYQLKIHSPINHTTICIFITIFLTNVLHLNSFNVLIELKDKDISLNKYGINSSQIMKTYLHFIFCISQKQKTIIFQPNYIILYKKIYVSFYFKKICSSDAFSSRTLSSIQQNVTPFTCSIALASQHQQTKKETDWVRFQIYRKKKIKTLRLEWILHKITW